jgi:hypothetical protein
MKKVESLFERARTDALTPEEMEKLWRNVAAAGAAGGLAGGEGAPGGLGRWLGGGGSGPLLKALAGLVVAGGIATAVVGVMKTTHAPPAPAPSAVVASPREAAAPSTEAAPPMVAWDDLPHAQQQLQADRQAPAKPARARSEGAPLSGTVSPGVNALPAESPPSAAGVEAASAPSPNEGALLLQARRFLASNPASALALTDDAARRFPDGPLTPEREVLAIEALAHLGREPEARARLAAFRSRYPESPHLTRLESLVTP